MHPADLPLTAQDIRVTTIYSRSSHASLYPGDCLDLLAQIPDGEASLIVTSPPYNIGKQYEQKRSLNTYLQMQSETIAEAVRICADDGSICWQVGNYIDNGGIAPLDIGQGRG